MAKEQLSFDLGAGRAAKGEAFDKVRLRSGEWEAAAMGVIWRLPHGWEGIGEDIRRMVAREVGSPHDPHAWGALISRAARQGYLMQREGTRAMRAVKSKARQSLLWVRT